MGSDSPFKKRKREVTAEIFAAAAESVIAQKGYEGATMQDIADAAGCAVGTLYVHFKNKEELFNAMVTRHTQAIASALNRASAGCSDPLQRLRIRNEAMLAYFNEHREFFQIFYAAGVGGRAHIASNLHGEAIQAYLEAKTLEIGLMRAAQAAGQVRKDIPAEELVEFLHGINVTTLARWSAEGNAPPPDEQKRLIWGLLAGGLGVRG